VVRTLDWPAVRVGALTASRDGRFLAVAVPPARILLWDLNQFGPPRVVADEAILADELLFTGDGAMLAIAGGFQVRLIRLVDGLAREILPLDTGRRGRLCFAASPDGRWFTSFGGIHPGGVQPVVLWDTATGRAEKSFVGRRKIEFAVFDRRSGSLILGNDYDITAWHPFSAREERLKRFDDHYDEVWTVAFAPNSATVASGGNDDRVRLWNPWTGARGAVLTGHKATVSTLAWHPGGERIATGSLSQDDNLPPQVRPAPLLPRHPAVRTEAVAEGHLLGVVAEDRSGRLGITLGADPGSYRFGQFGVDGCEHDRRLAVVLGDHAEGDVQAEEVLDQALHRAFGQAELASAQAEHRSQPGTEGAPRDALGERASGGDPTSGAGEAVHLVLDDLGSDRRDFGDLMPRGLGVGALQGETASGATSGFAGDGVMELVGRDQGSSGPLVPGLAAAFFARGELGRLTFEMDGVAGGGLRGVAGVGAEAVLERMNLTLQGIDLEPHRLDEGPDLDRQSIPNIVRQRRSRRHDQILTDQQPKRNRTP